MCFPRHCLSEVCLLNETRNWSLLWRKMCLFVGQGIFKSCTQCTFSPFHACNGEVIVFGKPVLVNNRKTYMEYYNQYWSTEQVVKCNSITEKWGSMNWFCLLTWSYTCKCKALLWTVVVESSYHLDHLITNSLWITCCCGLHTFLWLYSRKIRKFKSSLIISLFNQGYLNFITCWS